MLLVLLASECPLINKIKLKIKKKLYIRTYVNSERKGRE